MSEGRSPSCTQAPIGSYSFTTEAPSHRAGLLRSPLYGLPAQSSGCARSSQKSPRPFLASLVGLSARAWLFRDIVRLIAARFVASLQDLDALAPSH